MSDRIQDRFDARGQCLRHALPGFKQLGRMSGVLLGLGLLICAGPVFFVTRAAKFTASPNTSVLTAQENAHDSDLLQSRETQSHTSLQ